MTDKDVITELRACLDATAAFSADRGRAVVVDAIAEIERLRANATDNTTLAGDYADNCSTHQLRSFIDYAPELERLNKHRRTDWSQERLNAILYEAIAIREQ